MASNENFNVGTPQYQAERPLDKGMILSVPPQALPEGGFLRAKNVIAGPNGLKRRPVYARYGSFTVDYPPVQELAVLFKAAGDQETLLFDKKFLYRVANGAITGLYWTYTAGTIAISGTTVTGTGTGWTNEWIEPGDIIVLDANGSGDGPELAEVSVLVSATEITLTAAPTGTYAAGTDYAIRRAFQANNPYLLDYTIAHNSVFIADGGRFLYKYTAGALGSLDSVYVPNTTPPSITYQPYCIAHFADRLFGGHILEGGTDYRQRIRWSDLGANNFDTWGASSYVDLPYFAGAILRLLPMGNMLMVYAEDAVWAGTYANKVSNPLSFQALPTGGIGLAGMKAVAEWLDGHFFVGQDNIYYFSQRSGFEAIGTPIVQETIRTCENAWRIYASVDPKNDRVIFGFPTSTAFMDKMWSFNYKSKSWSYDEISSTCIRPVSVIEPLSWDTLGAALVAAGYTATWDNLSLLYPTWDSMRSTALVEPRTYFFSSGAMFSLEDTGTTDDGGSAPAIEIITGDKDYGEPDRDKTWYQMSIKLETYTTTSIAFVVQGSTNRGRSWKALGTLTVPANSDEGKVNFRLKGSMARFKITSGTAVQGYTINEIVYRVKISPKEIHGRMDG